VKAGACPLDPLAHFLPLVAANVSRWRALEREQGEAGRDRRSERIEAHKNRILAILEAKSDIAIEE
jgi:hypothetical protein